jgi:hypothetical protein
VFCANGCRAPHKGKTCKEAEDGEEMQRVRELLKDELLKCSNPACGLEYAGKDENCDHVTCNFCKWQFCFMCLAPRGPTLTHDNMWHAEGCTYFGAHTETPKRCRLCPEGGICPRPPPLTDAGRARLGRINAEQEKK